MSGSEEYKRIAAYVSENPMATLGTVNDNDTPHGAIVYLCMASDRSVCFITKSHTQKYINLTERPAVAVTIGNDKDSSTLQITGQARIIEAPELMDEVLVKITQIHARLADWLPPIAKLRAGNYAIIGIKITTARLGEFKDMNIGSREIFTEI